MSEYNEVASQALFFPCFVRVPGIANDCLPRMSRLVGENITVLLIARPKLCFPIIPISGESQLAPPTKLSRVRKTLAY